MLYKSKTSKTSTYYSDSDIVLVTEKIISKLKKQAVSDKRLRARMCLHKNDGDLVQEMIIAIHKSSYVRPHRHFNKSESYHMIEGQVKIVFFNDYGKVTKSIMLCSDRRENPFVYRLSVNLWHMVIPVSEFAVFHETLTGPFKIENNEFAPWSPEEGDRKGIKDFLGKI
jgi:cupin fold WbuC family metalloprotein